MSKTEILLMKEKEPFTMLQRVVDLEQAVAQLKHSQQTQLKDCNQRLKLLERDNQRLQRTQTGLFVCLVLVVAVVLLGLALGGQVAV